MASNGVGTAISDFFQNAVTGNLTQHQRDVIVAKEKADIAKAAAGMPPAVVKELQTRAEKELDAFLLKTDQGPLGTGSGVGLRLPGVGVVGTPEFYAKLTTAVKAFAIIGALLFGGWIAFKIFKRR